MLSEMKKTKIRRDEREEEEESCVNEHMVSKYDAV